MSKTHSTERVRALQREEKRGDLLEWYLENNFYVMPDNQCEDKRANGVVLWWLEPPIPNVTNPLLVERYLGDHWTLSIEPLPK
jgi:hypothetical protein